MRGGKSIWIIAGSIFVAWLLEPAWQWYFDRVLDSAARMPGGITTTISGIIAVTAPAHGFLLGVSVGMLLAFTIGYWDQIKERAPYVREWCRAILWLLWECRPGVRRLVYGMALLRPNEATRYIETSARVRTSDARFESWPKDKVYIRQETSDTILVARTDHKSHEELRVIYEQFGHYDFWQTIKCWREMDYIGLHFRYEKMKAEATRAKAASPPELPEFEP